MGDLYAKIHEYKVPASNIEDLKKVYDYYMSCIQKYKKLWKFWLIYNINLHNPMQRANAYMYYVYYDILNIKWYPNQLWCCSS